MRRLDFRYAYTLVPKYEEFASDVPILWYQRTYTLVGKVLRVWLADIRGRELRIVFMYNRLFVSEEGKDKVL